MLTNKLNTGIHELHLRQARAFVPGGKENGYGPTSTVEITVTSAQRLEELLDDAVAELQNIAMRSAQQGILVTRHAPGKYTAALTDSVPFGVTMERVL